MPELQKHTLLLEAGQYAKLQELHPDLGAAAVIRSIIKAYLQKVAPAPEPDLIKGELSL